ncbi:MAG: hypothetical protein H0W02_09390 [Ktedonobacteraceae bacterium]|nr:hypothetical protein [Ktedonobacteraceae bacterium]
MKRVYLAMQDSLAVIQEQGGQWKFDVPLEGKEVQAIAADPQRPEHIYLGSFGSGLWRSNDAGSSWEPVGEGIPHKEVMAVAVSPVERVGDYGVVWAGTEPSGLFRSEDGGNTWQERPSLLDLPSKPTWKFPPRPYTHHVRWIQPDPVDANRIFVAIELGGIMRSLDKGLTWEDRKPNAQPDGHTLAMHPKAPGRVYEAAGGESHLFRPRLRSGLPPVQLSVIMRKGGYAETHDAGATWETQAEGLDGHHYLWSLAVDPADPDTITASASIGPFEAHAYHGRKPHLAESCIIRRTQGKSWQVVSKGLPASRGTLISILTSDPQEPGSFYTVNNKGLFRSLDAGETWEKLPCTWPDKYLTQHARGLIVVNA